MKYAKSKDAYYFETSAKDGSNVEEMFQIIINTLLQTQHEGGFEDDVDLSRKKSVKINGKKKKPKHMQHKGCCN